MKMKTRIYSAPAVKGSTLEVLIVSLAIFNLYLSFKGK